MDKRKQCIYNRKHIQNRVEKEKAITNCVLPFLKGKIGVYIPIQGEVDVYHPLLHQFDLYVPKMLDSTTIAFYSDLEPKKLGGFHVMEPVGIKEEKDLDVILVPVVCFFKTYRCGYGKGYYDRYLINSKALKIGVAFDCQEMNFEIKPTDVQLDMIVTETRRIENENTFLW